MEENEKLFNDVHNYTKYKLTGMLIEKYKDSKLDNLNVIEQLSDDVLDVIAISGFKFYNELNNEFNKN